MKYHLATMLVGTCRTFSKKDFFRARSAAYNMAHAKGWKFRTSRMTNGGLIVVRLA